MKKENRWNEGNRWKQGWPLEEGEPLEGGAALRDMTMTLVQTTMALLVSYRQRVHAEEKRQWNGWSDTHVDLGASAVVHNATVVCLEGHNLLTIFDVMLSPTVGKCARTHHRVHRPTHRVKL
jgi:hypothetical protein